MDQRLRLVADFQNNASSGVKKLAKDLGGVKPTTGMAAAQKWFSDFRGGAEKTVDAVKPVSGLLTGVGLGGLAASLSMGELVKQFRELADSTATMKELGRQSSMTTTEIARLQYAAGKLHVDPAAMSGAIGSWSSKMVEFRMHTSAFYRDLMRQNSDVAAKIESDSPVDGLRRALDFISRIKDPQIQKRWADDAGLGDLVPMLAKGPEGLADAYAEATREVKPLSKELEQQAEKLNESLNRLDTTWSNFKREFGPTVIGGISGAVDQLKSVLDQVDAAKQRYAGHPESVTKDATANENAIGSHFVKHWQEVFRGERPILPNPFDSRSWHFPDVKDGLFDYTKGGDGEAPTGLGFSKTNTTQHGEDGNALRRWDEMPAGASAKWKTPDAYGREARARAASNTDGNALRRGDEMPAAVTAQQLFTTVREGSKEGIIAGLREMAQQQELGGPGSGTGGGAGDRGHGLPSMRYGRSPASGGYRRTPGQKYDLGEGGLGSRAPIASGLFKAKAPGIAARLKQDFPGLGDEDTAAILGNLGHESAGFKEFEEAHGKGPGRGWAQWTDPGRKARFFQFAKERGLDPHSDDANYGFLRWELTHTHKAAMDALRRAQGLRAKTRAFEQIFEGAGVKAYGSRDRYADSALAAIRGAPAAPATPGAGTPAPSAAAVSDAEKFKAQQRIINGGRNPADRALIERYKAQQAQPQAHVAGGPIRGPGGPRSDSILSWLSNGEYVVNAGAAGRFLPLLHAINSGKTPGYASGGPVGFGVDQRFYPKFTPRISPEEGKRNRRSWLNFFQRPSRDGGMGASRSVALGSTAMMNGETGWNLNSNSYGWDVNGPSGGAAQWHDVTTGRWAGKLHRLSDLMTFATQQHVDWHDTGVQQAFWKKEATSSLSGAWHAMRLARMAAGTLRQGINLFENPADHEGELRRRMPNIAKLAREDAIGGRAVEVDPVQIDIHHHPHTGRPIVTAKGGRGTKLGIRTAPTMRPT